MNQVNIKSFNFDDIPDQAIILIIGDEKMRTKLVEDLSKHQKIVVIKSEDLINKDKKMITNLGAITVVSGQFVNFPPNLRSKFDYIFMFWTPKWSTQRKLYECYGGGLQSYDLFKTIYRQCIEKTTNCLVFDNQTICDNPEDYVFYYGDDIRKEDSISKSFLEILFDCLRDLTIYSSFSFR